MENLNSRIKTQKIKTINNSCHKNLVAYASIYLNMSSKIKNIGISKKMSKESLFVSSILSMLLDLAVFGFCTKELSIDLKSFHKSQGLDSSSGT